MTAVDAFEAGRTAARTYAAAFRDPADAWDSPVTEPPATPSRFFQVLADIDHQLAARGPLHQVLTQHHTITEPLALADVVSACACTPTVQRDLTAWFLHVLPLITQATAPTPTGAADRVASGGEPDATHPTSPTSPSE